MLRLMATSIAQCKLDLTGTTVLTEAATGAYACTPIIAAMAGADKVYAYTKTTRHGTFDEVRSLTFDLAGKAQLIDRVEVIDTLSEEIIGRIDMLTNSGHLRPISNALISKMKPGSAIPIMYESWELRESDIDISFCKSRNVLVAGTNERHPDIDVFSYLGLMAINLLNRAGVPCYKSNILLICDNPFLSYVEDTLNKVGASVSVSETLESSSTNMDFDAVLIATNPNFNKPMGEKESSFISQFWPETTVVQFWGDIDRESFSIKNVYPSISPKNGHMGILPSEIGDEPIVRLQAGGLKVGSELLNAYAQIERYDEAIALACQRGYTNMPDFYKNAT
ncbi:hypothetical protein A8C75_08305 [Marinobacterium aestuarii]|uniref:Uncharacterized protein n=2 Tax=Marinobacterium aestuarii TaxID=1821621 RepID=A0A1A9EXM0_9GAMM|nr:hypothetical protein A8C75_08305 [Marinobacterium aestuarii]